MKSGQIAQRYSLHAELGAGGMGTVFRGMDSLTGQPVAVKQLKTEVISLDMLERFRREGEALRELNHPNIVKMLDAVEEDGHHYLVMEYVDGGDLAGLIARGRMPLETVLTLAVDLADALTRAHKLSIIHRDLKPANVLIGLDGVLRLTDFGVAHVGSKTRVTEADALIGTLDYLPPEAFSGGVFDARGDIWAFGVILFEMLTGERPYRGNSIGELIHAIVTQPVPDLEVLAPHAPTALVDLVYRMLERSPQQRIASVRHVGAALEDILHKRTSNMLAERFDTPLVEISVRPKHNLPAQATPFVGREHELDALGKLLADSAHRLITIIAPGGMGKTRLALETAGRHAADFARGAYWAELAPLQEPAGIPAAIATALGMQFQNDGRDELQQVCDYLQNKQLLLVLDNYEHLQEGAGVVSRLLQAASELRIMVTSRRRLDQPGETLFHLSGMEFPAWETPEDALSYAAVQLFMNSAVRARPDFILKTHDLDAVARICKLVEGMPLGIVLAAGWLAMLTPAEVAAELQGSIDVLESDSQQVPARQRSIRAVLDYSWLQMTEDEQAVFMKLSVFRGGFTREAAQETAGASLRVLMSLVAKSLIRRDAESGRYGIHELLRQYTEDRLRKAGLLDAARDAHAAYFAGWVAERERRLIGHGQLEALREVEGEFTNVESAWHRAVDTQQISLTGQMLQGLTHYFYVAEKFREASQLFWDSQSRVQDAEASTRIALRAVFFDVRGEILVIPEDACLAVIARAEQEETRFERALLLYTRVFYQINYRNDLSQAALDLTPAVELFEKLDERWWLANALQTVGYIKGMITAGEFGEEILALSQRSRQLFQEIGASVSALKQINNVANALYGLGENEAALSLIQELKKERIRLNLGGPSMIYVLRNESFSLTHKGLFDEALAANSEALALAVDYEAIEQQVDALLTRASTLILLHRYEEAQAAIEQMIALKHRVKAHFPDFWILSTQGFLHYVKGNIELALSVMQSAYEDAAKLQDPGAFYFQLWLGLCQIRVGRLEDAQHNLFHHLSELFVNDQAVGLYGIAQLYFQQGRQAEAVELAALLQDTPKLEYFFRSQIPDMLAEWRAAMPADVYDEAVARGKSLDFRQVIQALTT